MIFKKSLATILSAATILTAVSPCAFAEENNTKEKTTKSMSTTGKVILAEAGAITLGATAGIIYYMIKNSPVKVETLKGTSIYNDYMELYSAVANNNYEEAKYLLDTKKGLDINAKFEFGRTLLHIAAFWGWNNICELLIEKGANVIAIDDYNTMPLHDAIIGTGEPEFKLNIVRLLIDKLIDKRAGVNAQNIYGETPLHLAASNGHLKLCILLINQGAEVNAQNICGGTPLDYAINKEKNNVIDLLRSHKAKRGSELKESSVQGNMPINLPVTEESLVENEKNSFVTDKKLDETLIENEEKTSVTEEKLDETSSINLHNKLYDAVNDDKYEEVENLLNEHKELDVNAKFGYGWTLLHVAAFKNNLKMCKLLIEKGAKDADNDLNLRPLDFAKDDEVIQFLKKNGAKHGSGVN